MANQITQDQLFPGIRWRRGPRCDYYTLVKQIGIDIWETKSLGSCRGLLPLKVIIQGQVFFQNRWQNVVG